MDIDVKNTALGINLKIMQKMEKNQYNPIYLQGIKDMLNNISVIGIDEKEIPLWIDLKDYINSLNGKTNKSPIDIIVL